MKQSYKIPEGLNQSWADVSINLAGNSSSGIKPIPVKVILFWLIAFMMLIFIEFKSAVSAGPMWARILFAIVWLILMAVLGMRDKTGRGKYSLVAPLVNYIPWKSRHVLTRRQNRANECYSIIGIDGIDDETGTIHFADGTFGCIFSVVGSASILLFDEDMERIINRVDSFYRKVQPRMEWCYITMKEPQMIYRQRAAMKLRYDKLESNDSDLQRLADEQFQYLTNVVGRDYESIHQYLLVKTDNKELLQKAQILVQGEVRGSGLMFRQATMLVKNDVYNVLSKFYKGV